MKTALLPFLLLAALLPLSAQQYVATTHHLETARELLGSLDNVQTAEASRDFNDPRRKTWDRLPKVRDGLKIDRLTQPQKMRLHRFLQACLSQRGYLLVTAVMFNEDIQQKFEPNLGRNAFWIEVFGSPGPQTMWGFQLEGHHLSVNLTFRGEEMVSNTPFLMGSNPQVVDSDSARDGLHLIYREESLAGSLVASLSEEQRALAYREEGQAKHMYGEQYRDTLRNPLGGIAVITLEDQQAELVNALLGTYAAYFSESLRPAMAGDDLTFAYIGDPAPNGRHYYVLRTAEAMIECENYGNHTHHLWRSVNDFGEGI